MDNFESDSQAFSIIFLIAVVGALARNFWRRVGELIGRAIGTVMAFLKPGLSLFVVYLFVSVLHATLTKGNNEVTTDSNALQFGVDIVCAMMPSEALPCAPANRRMIQAESATGISSSQLKNPQLAQNDVPFLSFKHGMPAQEIEPPTNLLPEFLDEFREDIELHPEVFGLPREPKALPEETNLTIGRPANLLPEIFNERASLASEASKADTPPLGG